MLLVCVRNVMGGIQCIEVKRCKVMDGEAVMRLGRSLGHPHTHKLYRLEQIVNKAIIVFHQK